LLKQASRLIISVRFHGFRKVTNACPVSTRRAGFDADRYRPSIAQKQKQQIFSKKQRGAGGLEGEVWIVTAIQAQKVFASALPPFIAAQAQWLTSERNVNVDKAHLKIA
jgi:hypothetical protein